MLTKTYAQVNAECAHGRIEHRYCAVPSGGADDRRTWRTHDPGSTASKRGGRTIGSPWSNRTSDRLCSMLRRPLRKASPAVPSLAAGRISRADSMLSSTRIRLSCVSLRGAAGCTTIPDSMAGFGGSAGAASDDCCGSTLSSSGSKWHKRTVEDALQAAWNAAANPFTTVPSSCIHKGFHDCFQQSNGTGMRIATVRHSGLQTQDFAVVVNAEC